MFYTIQNDHLKVTVNSLGAELHSIQSADGTEYLWQGNPDVWDGQAPNIFPYVARLTEQKYTYGGKEYTMKIHGFINAVELTPEKQTKESITLRYDSNEETLAQYPFSFIYRITYALKGNVMHVTNEVENLGSTLALAVIRASTCRLRTGFHLRITAWSFPTVRIRTASDLLRTAS